MSKDREVQENDSVFLLCGKPVTTCEMASSGLQEVTSEMPETTSKKRPVTCYEWEGYYLVDVHTYIPAWCEKWPASCQLWPPCTSYIYPSPTYTPRQYTRTPLHIVHNLAMVPMSPNIFGKPMSWYLTDCYFHNIGDIVML